MDCENCYYYEYDEEFDAFVCRMDIDQDDMARILEQSHGNCPYFMKGDEYTVARKQ